MIVLIAHEVLTKSHWTGVEVNSVSLPDALSCWTDSLPDAEVAADRSSSESSALEVRSRLGVGVALRDQGNNDIIVPVRIHR